MNSTRSVAAAFWYFFLKRQPVFALLPQHEAQPRAMSSPMRLKVAVGLKQELIEIEAYPDTTWENATRLACALAGGLDPAIHRLLYRGRQPSLSDTMSGLGVKPTAKLMLLETEVSKRERAQAAQALQMEEMRQARAKDFSEKNRMETEIEKNRIEIDGNGNDATDASPADPVETSEKLLKDRTAFVDELERELFRLERNVQEAMDDGAGASIPSVKPFLVFANRAEKAILALDQVLTHGDEGLRLKRKALVTRMQGMLLRGDEAKGYLL